MMIAVIVVVVVVVVLIGVLAEIGVFTTTNGGGNANGGGSSPPSSGTVSVYSGSASPQPRYSTPEGGFQWGWGGAIQREDPSLTTVSWSASYPASVCLVYTGTQAKSYSYSGCQAASYSSTSAFSTSGVWSVSIPPDSDYNESGYYVWWVFEEPALPGGQADQPLGKVWTNSSTQFLVGSGPGDLATVQSYSEMQTWTSASISLPSSQTQFAAYLNFTSPAFDFSVSASLGFCSNTFSDSYICQGGYSGSSSLQVSATYNTTAAFSLTLQVIAWS